MGFIEKNKGLCMSNVLTNPNMLLAACETGVKRFFYASSACVYNAARQTRPDVVAFRECDAYPAMPENGYGWEKPCEMQRILEPSIRDSDRRIRD